MPTVLVISGRVLASLLLAADAVAPPASRCSVPAITAGDGPLLAMPLGHWSCLRPPHLPSELKTAGNLGRQGQGESALWTWTS